MILLELHEVLLHPITFQQVPIKPYLRAQIFVDTGLCILEVIIEYIAVRAIHVLLRLHLFHCILRLLRWIQVSSIHKVVALV